MVRSIYKLKQKLMHCNLRTHRRVKAGNNPDEKYRQSMLTNCIQKPIKDVRNSLESPLTLQTGNGFQLPQEAVLPQKPLKRTQSPKNYQIVPQSASSLLATMTTLKSKIQQAQTLLRSQAPQPPQSTIRLLSQPSIGLQGDLHSYFSKRENTSLSTMNLESQKQLNPVRCREKMTWAANLKQYYVGQVARGVNGINDKALEHLYESHHFFLTESIEVPQTYTPLNLICHASDKHKKVLVIDMDETLIHCHPEYANEGDIQVQIEQGEKGYIAIRPYALSFLKKMNKYFEIIVFTASEKSYADLVLDQLDPEGLIKHRLYRENCLKLDYNLYVKDLRVINRDLSQMVLVDNSAISFLCQPQNGIPILPFCGGEDHELLELQKYLQSVRKQVDVREMNRRVFKLQRYRQFQDCQELVNELYGEGPDYY